MKKVFVAATEQNAGKTTLCLGLYRAAQSRGYKTAFIKPVGQRYMMEEGEKVDEDAVLFKKALAAEGLLKNLNPVTIPRGFTRNYIFNRDPEKLRGRIREAFESLGEDHDLVIIEGTGHAGVGSVVDASNALVADMLDTSCVIVSGGGIGRCIDEICLNRALFREAGVPLIGAVINKVYEEKYDKVSPAVKQGLKNNDIDCLGVIPYRKELMYPTMRQLKEELGLEALCGEGFLSNRVTNIIVAAMAPQNMISYLEEGSLVVVPGDRIDNILASVNAYLLRERSGAAEISGLLLTGGFIPHLSIINILCQVDVPVLLSEEDTATAAFRTRSLVAKISHHDKDKIQVAEKLVRNWVDMDRIFDYAG